jgi:hypothetical protein
MDFDLKQPPSRPQYPPSQGRSFPGQANFQQQGHPPPFHGHPQQGHPPQHLQHQQHPHFNGPPFNPPIPMHRNPNALPLRPPFPGMPPIPLGLPGRPPFPPPFLPPPFPPQPMTPPSPESPEPALPEKDPRLDDPWLQSFIKKYAESLTGPTFEWTPANVRARLREALDVVEQLKAVSTEMKNLKAKKHNDPSLSQLAGKAHALKSKVDELLSVFVNEDPQYLKFKHRMLKSKRHKSWLKRAREKARKTKKDRAEKKELMHRLIDEWRTRIINEDTLRRKAEEDKKQALAKERERVRQKKHAAAIADVLMQLEELRAVRLTHLELEGQPVPKSKTLYEVVKEYLKDHPLEPEEKKADKIPEVEMEPVDEGLDEEPAEKKPEQAAAAAAPAEAQPERKAPSEDEIKQYYELAYQSLDKLIEIRRAWDIFLVPPGFGTRIPPVLISAPSPSSKKWSKYLKKPKKQQTQSDA